VKQFSDKLSTVVTLCNIPLCHIYNMNGMGLGNFSNHIK